ncbi:PREDICTED: ventral anterior homeobox 2-like [Nicrophorus vespilloides]|uniref:Ventral anterior homeobox 2-like n=1 Tax=Nicrophorus vespilloides TaxID=110193 RepID=A0ABM1M562_NICVS|nr:PREDICTED: ventral anterior homeobox 2-like [Nicrophorus vespilloides]
MAQEQASENAGSVARPRRARTSFTSFQLNKLEETFKKVQFISRPARYNLSLELNLQEKKIKIWFQNRRIKENIKVAANMATAMNSPSILEQNNHQQSSTTWYNSNSSLTMDQDLGYASNVQSSASNSPNQQIPFQNINFPGPSSSLIPLSTYQSPVNPISPSTCHSNSPPLNLSAYEFNINTSSEEQEYDYSDLLEIIKDI